MWEGSSEILDCNGEEYKELSSLALHLLVISPTSVICERGFSVIMSRMSTDLFLHNRNLMLVCYDRV